MIHYSIAYLTKKNTMTRNRAHAKAIGIKAERVFRWNKKKGKWVLVKSKSYGKWTEPYEIDLW